MIRRRTTLYPVIPSIVTIALAIALLAAGTIPESGKDNFWLSVGRPFSPQPVSLKDAN